MKARIAEIDSALENGGIHSPEHINRVVLLSLRDLIHANLKQAYCWTWTMRIVVGVCVFAIPFMIWASTVVVHAMIEKGWKPF